VACASCVSSATGDAYASGDIHAASDTRARHVTRVVLRRARASRDGRVSQVSWRRHRSVWGHTRQWRLATRPRPARRAPSSVPTLSQDVWRAWGATASHDARGAGRRLRRVTELRRRTARCRTTHAPPCDGRASYAPAPSRDARQRATSVGVARREGAPQDGRWRHKSARGRTAPWTTRDAAASCAPHVPTQGPHPVAGRAGLRGARGPRATRGCGAGRWVGSFRTALLDMCWGRAVLRLSSCARTPRVIGRAAAAVFCRVNPTAGDIGAA